MSAAIIQLVMSTAAQGETTLAWVADNLRHNASLAGERAQILDNLAARGWKLVKVHANEVDTDTYDVVVYVTKEFASSHEAEAEATACGCCERLNFSFLWKWDGTFDDDGYPNYEWGGECA